ncbi:MAG: UDP-N-acetylmuramate--L-alanine ligase [Thermoanaerobaculia bacterium]
MNFNHIKKIHFVGIGGIGMSGIAEILARSGFTVSGCDLKGSSVTERLVRDGIPVFIGHDAAHLAGVDLVVTSSAIRRDNGERITAEDIGIEVIRRAEMLGELMRLKKGIAISGTHGKTTTTAMTSVVLQEGGLEPTVIVGGMIREVETNAQLGAGEYLVVEADEYDRSFLSLHPAVAVITNIEADHLDTYRDLGDIRDAFTEFAGHVPARGVVIGCADDAEVAALLDAVKAPKISYGLGEAADLRATNLTFDREGTKFEVELRGETLGPARLKVPGEHNVRNALAAIGVAVHLEIPFAAAARALERFGGVERRFQILGEINGAILVDDYAHHPTEIRATLAAARRSYPDRRLIALFQPHLYSRTRDFAEEFGEALSLADLALVAPIYPAREEPIAGVDASLITRAAEKRGHANVQLIDLSLEEIVAELRKNLVSTDLLLTMGAGDIHRAGEALAAGGAA